MVKMSRTNLTRLAYDVIKENVLSGKIEAGRILEAAPLSRFLSISRTPVSAALAQLAAEDVLAKNPQGRGYVVGNKEQVFRADIGEGDVWLPKDYENSVNDRIGRTKFYPRIEEEITACLPFGRFAVNVTRLAAHYGISRPNAHTALMRLERLGLVSHEGARWFAGPLSKDDIRETLGRSPDKGDSVAMTFVADLPAPKAKPREQGWRGRLLSSGGGSHWDQSTA